MIYVLFARRYVYRNDQRVVVDDAGDARPQLLKRVQLGGRRKKRGCRVDKLTNNVTGTRR
jgi:hypothetical protein